MLTVSQVAERLNVSQSIVYSLVDKGLIVCHRIGLGRGAIRISEEDLARYLKSCRDANSSSGPKLKHINL